MPTPIETPPKLRPLLNALLGVRGRPYPELAPLVAELADAIWSTRPNDVSRYNTVKWALGALAAKKLPAGGDESD